jgi:hypothetical protein
MLGPDKRDYLGSKRTERDRERLTKVDLEVEPSKPTIRT